MTESTSFPFLFHLAQEVRADSRTPVIRRRGYEVCTVEYVTRGAGYLRTNGEFYTVPANSVYFLHKGSTHEYWPEKSDPWHKLFFVVDGPLMEELFRIHKLDRIHFIPDAKDLRPFFETFLDLDRSMPRLHEKAAVLFHGFTEACGAHLAEKKEKIPENVEKLKRTIEESLDKPFQLAAYCRQEKIAPAHAVRLFQRYCGCSPVEYLLRKKLEMARQFLRYTSLSVKEIAARLRFCDQYHFSSFYKKRTGESPTIFREKWK
ncbi:MAG: helix-turn-helix transcriptional regulator [Lentisphaeria bacterium]|nr:helix-turn-helix transcriptional regulator [Lentisphaeria bacterium]